MSSLRNLIRRRLHKERAQPKDREKRYGLLEKKKDYKLRAIDYHRKKDTIHKLRKKAAFRNPDEFYFKMNSSKTEEGVHIIKKRIRRDAVEIKSANTQDLSYLQMKHQQEAKKIDELRGNLHMLEGGLETGEKGKHTIFVDKPEKLLNFDAAKFFDTAPELLAKTYNRVKIEDLEKAGEKLEQEGEETVQEKRVRKKNEKKRLQRYRELAARIERKRKLGNMIRRTQTQRNLMGKGPRRKIVKLDEFGREDKSKTIHKWKTQRKK
mmetsp:Transcript_3255/g.7617  ORF Transcript_3255/g.7617 Transcript_3255/m.7617 type:complete len:265 (-) Transcript_3255:197-991(-)|eukprot:CAMPEP_0114512900 /NCGR_PEP_ID=MMETSP0109-20121206/15249_1 /TAXON_ID=29199 /ORGANISM="Chlorarachnion reptans, Strain CCCM449" /LENGTH=264 /DNA_ID=CAMNT_0001692669 /DNA_START=189 /DNA_END=983 /DNA_ORIENTATION=+